VFGVPEPVEPPHRLLLADPVDVRQQLEIPRLDVLRAVAEDLGDADLDGAVRKPRDPAVHAVAAPRVELDAENPHVGAGGQIVVQGIAVHGACGDAQGVRVGRGRKAGPSEEHRSPWATGLVKAADQQEWELSVELPMLLR
jgi:hypothetical protein